MNPKWSGHTPLSHDIYFLDLLQILHFFNVSSVHASRVVSASPENSILLWIARLKKGIFHTVWITYTTGIVWNSKELPRYALLPQSLVDMIEYIFQLILISDNSWDT